MTTLADLARRAAKLAIDNSPAILTTLGAAGVVSTAYFAGRASFEASDIIRIKEADDDERGVSMGTPQEVMKDRIQLVWKLYIPAVTMGAATIACVIGANRISAGRAAGMATAYTILEKNFSDQKARIIEKLGERKAQTIDDEIMQDRVMESHHSGVEIYGAEIGELCYDKFSDRYFRSTVEGIRGIQNEFNHGLLHDGYMSLAEFYRMLDMPAPAYAESIGWNADQLMEVKISTVLTPDQKACLAIDFREEPKPDYGRFH